MSYAQITIDDRGALHDALVALRAHRDALVLVGAQATYRQACHNLTGVSLLSGANGDTHSPTGVLSASINCVFA